MIRVNYQLVVFYFLMKRRLRSNGKCQIAGIGFVVEGNNNVSVGRDMFGAVLRGNGSDVIFRGDGYRVLGGRLAGLAGCGCR